MTKTINIFYPGTEVIIDNKIDGIINFVSIYDDFIKYHVNWWDNNTLQGNYFTESRLSIKKTKAKTKIGFKYES